MCTYTYLLWVDIKCRNTSNNNNNSILVLVYRAVCQPNVQRGELMYKYIHLCITLLFALSFK